MTLKECYEQMHGDYEGVPSRLGSEGLVQRFALKFLNDPTFNELQQAMKTNDGEAVFRNSHTLKGICLNLGFTSLYEVSAALTEKLRGNNTLDPSCDELFTNICTEYDRTIHAIQELNQ